MVSNDKHLRTSNTKTVSHYFDKDISPCRVLNSFFLNGGQHAQTLIENKVYMLHFPVIFKQSDIIPASVVVSFCKIKVMRAL